MQKKTLSPIDLLLAAELSNNAIKRIYKKYGFEDVEKADKNLQAIARDPYIRRLLSEVIEALFDMIRRSPDPDMTLNNLERFCNAVFDLRIFISQLKANPKLTFLLINLFSTSQFLSDILIRNPEYLWWLIEERAVDTFKGRDDILKELRANILPFSSFEKKLNAIRRIKRREILRIGLRDILGYADIDDVTAELSYLSDALLQTGYEICCEELIKKYGRPMYGDAEGNLKEAGYAVISMGKLGGEELNFSSDIDLIFVYDEEGETEGILKYDEHTNRITNNLFFIKLGESIIHAISEITDEGYCYRIDMRLRPEGRVGALARSLNNTEVYYESWGETWERQALIKARFSAGNEDVGRRFVEMIRPFIYRKYMDYASITEIKHTKDRIDQVIGGRGEKFHQVKLGYGGIREIEFIVQALQILYGGRELNYGSDLDIIFVYSAPAYVCHSCMYLAGIHSYTPDINIQGKAGFPLKNVAGMTESENLQTIFKLCENIINASSEIMDEGILYRIDPRLRPLGKDGPLAMDIEAYKKYFKEWAQLWERQAYIKARHVAGDRELAGDFIRLAHDFVYSSPITDNDITEINSIRQRMIDELIKSHDRGRNIKLSAGGIVDIESIVQILQLRYGYADKDVRNANTISALRSLKEKGYISEADHHSLVDAYYFLRGIEHGLRIVEDSVQNILPMDEDALNKLARRIGYEGRNKSGSRLFKDFKVKCKIVREIYNKVFLSHQGFFHGIAS